MKTKSGLLVLLSVCSAFAGVQNLDTKVASCGAAVSVSRNGSQLILTVDNQNCNEVRINLPGLSVKERLTRGAVTNLDISKVSGAKIPVSIDNEFLALDLSQSSAGTNVVIEQSEEQKRLTQLQIQEAERKRAAERAKATAAGAAVVGLAGAAVVSEASKGEH